ncbi:MAG: Imm10 family immunity protein [Fimbriiglobus sp.]
MVRFEANTVVVDDSDPSFILVGFADEKDGVCRDSLHFQRSHEFDAQDVAMGMDSVYAERTGWGGYGGVERVELYRDRVRVVIGRQLAVSMATPEFDIGISLPPGEWQRLRDGLRVVFAGFDSLVEALGVVPE